MLHVPFPLRPAVVLMAMVLLERGAVAAGPPDDRDHALPCRPTVACTADVVPPGTFEVEAGFLAQHTGTGAGAAAQKSFPFLLKLTLAPWVQLQVGSNGYTVADGSAPQRFFDNTVLGLKFHLLDQKGPRPAIALSGSLSIPTLAGQEGYVRTWDAFFTAHVSKDVGPIHGDLNVGLDVWRFEASPRPQGFGTLALSASPVGVFLEGYAFSSAAPVTTQDGGVRFGVTLSPKGWLTFDLGGDAGFFPSIRSFSAFAGITVIPAVLWR